MDGRRKRNIWGGIFFLLFYFIIGYKGKRKDSSSTLSFFNSLEEMTLECIFWVVGSDLRSVRLRLFFLFHLTTSFPYVGVDRYAVCF
jgi:hypothetical protein